MVPVPNYHNMLTVISELIEFLLIKEVINGKVGVLELATKGNKSTEDWLPVKNIQNGIDS